MLNNEKTPAATEVLKKASNSKPDAHIVGQTDPKENPDLTGVKEFGLPLNANGIPAELRERKAWILTTIKRKPDGGMAKPPVSGFGSRSPESWLTFKDAARRASLLWANNQDPEMLAIYPAYVLQDGDGCVDLDMHTPDETGLRMDHYARLMTEAKNCYVERSISGSGWHIIGGVGSDVTAFNTKEEGTDIQLKCHSGHYVCLTGALVDGARPVMMHIAHVVNAIPRRDTQQPTKEATDKARPSSAMLPGDNAVASLITEHKPDVARLLANELANVVWKGKSGSDLTAQLIREIADFCTDRNQLYRIVSGCRAFTFENRHGGKIVSRPTPDSYSDYLWYECQKAHTKDEKDIMSFDLPSPLRANKAAPCNFVQDGSDLNESPTEFIIENVLPVGLTIIYGESRHYKTFAAIHAASTVAQGSGYFGVNRVQGGGVYILAAEAPEQMAERLQGWKDLYNDGKPLPNLFTVRNYPELTDQKGWQELGEMIKSHAEQAGIKPRLIVIDTFSRIARGINEDLKADVVPVLQPARDMAVELGVALVMTHHTNKGDKLSGSQAFYNESDAIYKCQKPEKLFFTLQCEKMKSADEPPQMKFGGTVLPKADRFMQKLKGTQWTTVTETGAELRREELYGTGNTVLAFGGIDLAAAPGFASSSQPTGKMKNGDLLLSILADNHNGLTKEELRVAWEGKGGAPGSFRTTLSRLIDDGSAYEMLNKFFKK